MRDHDQWVRDIVKQLIEQDDGRSLVTAALIMSSYAPLFRESSPTRADYTQRIMDLMDRAVKRAPGDPIVAIIAKAYCLGATNIGCDSTPYDQALQASDPGNALAYVGALRRALGAQDRAQQERVVHLMANSNRVDDHYQDVDSLLSGVVDSVRVPIPDSMTGEDESPTRTLVSTIRRFTPGLSVWSLESVCKPPMSEDLHADCQRIVDLGRSAQGNLRRNALGIAAQLNGSGSAEVQSAVAVERRRAWQFINAMRLSRTPEQTRRIRSGDYDAAIEVLNENAVSLEPPPGWTP